MTVTEFQVRNPRTAPNVIGGYFHNVVKFPGVEGAQWGFQRDYCRVLDFTAPAVRPTPPTYGSAPAATAAPVRRQHVAVNEWNKTVACDTSLNHTRLRVALLVGTFADFTTGQNVRPKKRTVAISLGLTRETVSRHVNALVRAGYLEVVALQEGGATSYRLTIPAVGV